MNSCDASYCTFFPKVLCASVTSVSWPTANAPLSCHLAFTVSVLHNTHKQNHTPPAPKSSRHLGVALNAVDPCKLSNGSPLPNSSFVLRRRSPLPHEVLSPPRNLCALRCANYLSVSLPNRSLLVPSSTTASALLSPSSQFSTPAVGWVAPLSTASAHLKTDSSHY